MSNTYNLRTIATDLDQEIEEAEAEIKQQKATIAALATEGHEVTDAKKHLGQLLLGLRALIRRKLKAKA
jgi:hypothetical protein